MHSQAKLYGGSEMLYRSKEVIRKVERTNEVSSTMNVTMRFVKMISFEFNISLTVFERHIYVNF